MAAGKPLSAKESQDLNTKLADRSFLGNTSDATAEDVQMFGRVAAIPNRASLPHLARWYLTMSLKVQASHPHRQWPEAGAKKAQMKKNVADKVIDVPVVSVPAGEAREKPLADASRFPLGAGAKSLNGAKKPYYVTTAINYANGWPHLGHGYEALTADVFARYHRLNGEDAFYVTGSDEHGAKIAEVAEANGITPQQSVDRYVDGFKALNQRLLVSNDFYVRTTSDAHKEVARAIWKMCKDKGDIYLAHYEGWYLTREERYVTEVEAQEWNYKDPGSGKPLDKRNEPSYFFRLSKYADRILKHIKENPSFIQPEQYRTEILSRLESIEMRDLSISRGTFSWGVPCPEPLEASNGQQHVMYVWFDALINYISAVHGIDKKHPLSKYWPADVHIIGKDISWFHTVIWPSMLMSAEIALPKCVVVHGFIAGPDGRKMSKTYGNVVSAHDELETVSADTFRWFLCREAAYGDELKYSQQSMKLMHNADLCDNLGNLVNRAVKICGGSVPEADTKLVDMPFDLKKAKADLAAAFEQHRLSDAANITIQACKDTNKWVADLEPWKMKDASLEQKKAAVLRLLLESVYVLAHFFSPFIPTAGAAIFKKLSSEPVAIGTLKDNFSNLKTGTVVNSDSILFEPLDVDAAAPAAGAAPKAEAKAAPKAAVKATPKAEAKAEAKAKAKAEAKPAAKKSAPADAADQPTFSKIDIRVGKVVDAWHHPSAERLFIEKIDVGEAEPRQIISGLREHYSLEEFKGRKLLAVCNLKPAKLVGEQSFGMVLCAKKDSKVELISVPDSCEVGQRVLPAGVSFDWQPLEPNQVAKKKVWDEIAKELKTNGDRFACFEGSRLVTENGTEFQAPSCSDSIIS